MFWWGGFFVNDSSSGISIAVARAEAASAMATQAHRLLCRFNLANDLWLSRKACFKESKVYKVFEQAREPRDVPVVILESVRELSITQWLHPLTCRSLCRYNMDFVERVRAYRRLMI